MLGMYLTTAINFLAVGDKSTISDGMGSIWSGLGQAMMKVKEAIYAVLPQLMTFLGDAWIILIPFGIFVIIKILNFFRVMVKGF
ncbi:MAG: hypothetical protein EIB84_06505 [Spiroplasma poulsonii]|uniref:Spiroplasmavirus-related protein n=1 Tax=Spiroplasma poulsonii TaxID=2138 RepID=A0A2P6FA50_9MOLU|nr:hypothetical protein [Spiroplasma poulsonii]KAF0852094.1 plectrovirus spv1-r8a2b orf7 transmembrane protein [Spiroplasma poulsonii]MBW1242407.1 hypothetical protein [Spiroplasma poulsonii]PQM30284.1 hypothetical protein SMSRO_SF000400 [Spiroplasma poulsonii]PWF95247.1 hypothetical protein SMSE_06720 [Spiroplasma poulsonii]PWF98036.1 hypothetical protein SMH99_05860 [Spiroplasma poulsonii]